MAMNGDVVHIHYICRDEEGNIVDDSIDSDESVCFEVSHNCNFSRHTIVRPRSDLLTEQEYSL